MGLISRLFRRSSRKPQGQSEPLPAEEKRTVRREELGPPESQPEPATQDGETAPSSPVAVEASAVADAAMREALNAVQGVVDKARSYITEIANLQAKKTETAPPQPAPAVGQTTGLMTEASASVLIEYLKHFFDLVSMQNRLLERRLDSLEELLSRLDQHVTEDAAEVSARLSNLEGVQLPLVKSAETAGTQPANEVEAEGPPQEIERADAAVAGLAWSEPKAPVTEQEPRNWTTEVDAELEPEEQIVAAELSGLAAPEMPQETAGDEDGGRPADVGRGDEPEAGTPDEGPVHGTLQFQGLVSFQSLFAIRDELRRREVVFSAEAASFEAGRGELRFRADRALEIGEVVAALVAATGQEFVATGPTSYAARPAESHGA